MLFPGDSFGDDRRVQKGDQLWCQGLWSRSFGQFLGFLTQPQQKWGLRQFGPYKSKIQAILRGFLYDNWGKTSNQALSHLCSSCGWAGIIQSSSKGIEFHVLFK